LALAQGERYGVPSLFSIAIDILRYFAQYRNMNLVFKALSDPTRRQILHLLRKKPMTAGDLAEHFSLAKPTLSAHFAILRGADLIEGIKSGTVITYMLKTGKAK
jgi:DNA-binding transcriptional ArsR family regulator